ncbi:MAG: RNA polymerase sigma factor [Oscillospiraceae bacterium]|nr:RNA polymerase sigma factor [Oscillospiraceae bacterium]
MEDAQIVGLYWARDERAIDESSGKYGAYCGSIAYNILADRQETEECVNDTWLGAWNSMPPHRPVLLAAFLGRITRNLAFNLYKKLHREKRGGSNIDLVLDELADCVSGGDDPANVINTGDLTGDIDLFLSSLPETKQRMFILRYWYADSIGDIAERLGLSENNVSVTLNRVRKQLRDYLTDRGYDL